MAYCESLVQLTEGGRYLVIERGKDIHDNNAVFVCVDLTEDGYIIPYYITKRGGKYPYSELRAGQVVLEAVQFFSETKLVKGLRAQFFDSNGIKDEYNSVCRGLCEGLEPEEALSQTCTGRLAEKLGYKLSSFRSNSYCVGETQVNCIEVEYSS